MAARKTQGVLDDQRISPEDISVNVLPLGRRIRDWLRVPGNVVMSLMVLAGAAAYYSDFGGWVLLLALGLAIWGKLQKESAPLKMPIQGKTDDPNQIHPGTGAASPGQGIFFIGNDLRSGKEVWLTNDDCRQHFLILGTTGAGKALPNDAFVRTPTGWRRMGELRRGDLVSTPDGGSSPVGGVFPQGERDICLVSFEDGRKLEASDDHLWEVFQEGADRASVVTTSEIDRLLRAGTTLSIRLPAPVEGTHTNATLDIRAFGRSLTQPDGAAWVAGFLKTASLAQRRTLLLGTLEASPDLFHARTSHLAVDVAEIARSLGGTAIVGTDGTVRISGLDETLHPVAAPGGARIAITGVSMNIRRAPATCIAVDHPDHLFVAGDYVVTHNTESLLGFAANALSWGSGFLFCDGKGDVALFAKVYAMARRFGREDDLLVLNFMTGNKDLGASGGDLLSNTLNPFSNGSSDGLTQMVVSLMDDVGGDGAMWKGRATAMLTGVMRALCWLRDRGYLDLNVSEIRDYMSLKKIIELADEAKHPDLPGPIRKSIRSYLGSLPGFQEEKKEKQAQTTLDQHGYLEMQFTKILGSLADVYGHIFATPYGEVDMYDVVLNRRILVIMLPALEKSGDEIANLGKIVVATLKGMMGATLGSKLEGTWDDVVENRPTNSPSPFLCILDEVGYYTVEGMALMAAQARSLGFSMCYASQDINAMKRLNEKEAASIIANTNTKIFMKTEDPNETADLAVKRGGKALRVRAGGYDRRIGELSGKHAVESESASFEDAEVVQLADLTGQASGEMHVMFGDKVVRARGFYAQPEGGLDKKLLNLRANHFVKVPRPSMDSIGATIRGPEILDMLSRPGTPEELRKAAAEAVAGLPAAVAAKDEIAMAAMTFERLLEGGRKPIEAACASVADVMRALTGHVTDFGNDVRGAYGAPVPAPNDGFDLNDFEDSGEGGGFGEAFPEARRRGRPDDPFENDDPFSAPNGVPLSPERAPPLPPPRMGKPFGVPRKPQRVDPGVRHGATVDEGGIINMADRIASNDAIMKSLAALDFDGDQVTSQQVEARIEEALGGSSQDQGARGGMPGRVDGFERASAAVQTARPMPEAKSPIVDEDDEAGGGEYVSDFLEGLLGDKDDD